MRAWRVVILFAVVGAISRCTCAPPCSNHSAPNATFQVAKGCAGYYCGMFCDPGFVDCNGDQTDGCELTSAVPNGTITTSGDLNTTCSLTCVSGTFNCDGILGNGCESKTACTLDAGTTDSGEPKGAHVIADILTSPHGLVACAGHEFYFDGMDLISIDSATLATFHVVTSSAQPVGGLACDGTYLYWGATGFIMRAPVSGSTEQVFTSAINPTSGIDVRDGGVYVMTASGVEVSLGDAGAVVWMPATQSNVYKPFALGKGEDWSVSGASIERRAADAGAATWLADAGTPRAIFVNASGDPIVVSHVSDAGDLLAHVRNDAGAATFAPLDASVHPVVATSGGSPAVVASDDAIYVVAGGSVTPLFLSADHIVDVAIDGPWVVWTTRAPAAVWRGALP